MGCSCGKDLKLAREASALIYMSVPKVPMVLPLIPMVLPLVQMEEKIPLVPMVILGRYQRYQCTIGTNGSTKDTNGSTKDTNGTFPNYYVLDTTTRCY